MKFRTEVKIAPFSHPIALNEQIVALGSCFASELSEALTARNLQVLCNPLGPLYNPLSIAAAVERALSKRAFSAEEIATNGEGERFSFDASTRFTDPSCEELLKRLNTTNDRLCEAIERADRLILTFGTAWVFRLAESNEVVANCHKQPQQRFRRERLSVEEIVARWSALLEGPLQKKQVLLTVSPIRHLGDGLEGNAVSKATLRLAVEQLVERCSNCRYFPAYELLLDDLRDYRYYADDLCHPSTQALAYIRERFAEAAFSEQTKQQMKEVEHLLRFCAHRPHDPASEEYQRQSREVIRAMQESPFDFSEEIALLRSRL